MHQPDTHPFKLHVIRRAAPNGRVIVSKVGCYMAQVTSGEIVRSDWLRRSYCRSLPFPRFSEKIFKLRLKFTI